MGLELPIRGLRAFRSVILAALLAGALPGATYGQSIQQVAATVNDDVISTYDLDQRVKMVIASSGVQPSADIMERVRNQILRALVDERLKLQEARKNDIAVTDEEITKSISDIAKRNNLPPSAIQDMLSRAGVEETTLREQIRADDAWNKLMSQKYGSRIFVSDSDVDAELERLTENFNEMQYLVSEIVLNVNDPNEDEDVRRTAERLLGEMQRGAPFSGVAEQFSQAPSAAQGGDLGWVLPEDLDPEIAKNLPKMVPGQVTPPIRTSSGYQLIALRSKRRGSDGEPGQVISATLKQLFTPVPREHHPADIAEAQRKLEAARTKLKGCSNVESVAEASGVLASDLGKVPFNEIAPFFRSTVSTLAPGQASEPIESPAGVHLIVMCDRAMTEGVKATPPTRQEVEARLWGEQMSVIERRYLRDLRRDSTVEYR